MSLLSRLAVQAARAYGILSSSDKTKVPASYLVVAGGGGRGNRDDYYAGGGGAGGLLTSTATLSTLVTYTVTVGAGGAKNVNGSNSVLSGTGLTTLTSVGGGKGATNDVNGSAGGSGGGAGGNDSSTTGGSPTSGQGNAGGNVAASPGNSYGGAGGGGASSAGSNVTTINGGAGGAGLANSISGSSVTYSAGGGGMKGYIGTDGANGTGWANASNLGHGGAPSVQSAGSSGVVIISYTSATPRFVGGTLTTSGGNQIHTFTSSGTLSPLTPVTASYLVVAGGGGGGTASGGFYAGGGGAGGLLTSSTTLYSGATYVVTVGGGGAINTSGSNSVLSGTGLTTVTSTGGGRGGAFQTNGAAGGSGGGSGGDGSGGTYTGGLGTSGQGNNGGNSAVAFGSTNTGGGGGGGAGAAGSNSPTSTKNGGAGGAGLANSLSGSSVTYSAGGGGMAGNDGTGGTVGANGTGWIAAPNLGHGGGPDTQRTGSSGTVIISYAGSQVFNGGLVTSSGGNTIHTFNATGALTPVTNNLNNSLRFRSSASAYLNRTPASAGNRQIMTYSFWVKRGAITGDYNITNATTDASNSATLYFNSSNSQSFDVFLRVSGTNYTVRTTQVFRDPSAWYHIVVAIDTTQATSANRTKIYVNGSQVTALTASYVPQNSNLAFNNNVAQYIGFSNYFDGYMTDINFIDGQALEPYYFGNNDANGVWKPILYKGTYGTNGFYLTFGNTTSTTTLGYDSSPNGNNWTTNNISLTAGVTYDAMTDVPTNTSATVANYATLNPLDTLSTSTPTFANLRTTYSSSIASKKSTIVMTSGKWYTEWNITGSGGGGGDLVIQTVGIISPTATSNAPTSSGVGYYSYGDGTNSQKFVSGTATTYGTYWGNAGTYTLGAALDITGGTITFYLNGVSQGAITLPSNTDGWVFVNSNGTSTGTCTVDNNFGQRPFAYTPPSGFVALNTFNLPTPTILQGNKYMDATLYTGTGTTQVIVNQALFKPDLVWQKPRSEVASHRLVDSVRGVNKTINSNQADAEATETNTLTSFNSNGFTGGGSNAVTSGNTAVAWQWQAGQGSTTTGTGTGGITSVSYSVSTTAGFSVVIYTGSGSNGTVTHGLGVAPKMIMVKNRTTAGGNGIWRVYHTSLGGTKYINLNETTAATTGSTVWNNTDPTSSVFSVGTTGTVNDSGNNYVAYCWAEIAGFSKFGSYTGNGSTDGPFVYTGFRPKFVMFKRTDAVESWYIWDTSTTTYNAMTQYLVPNTTAVEGTFTFGDYLSNGFKVRNTAGGLNASGGTFIYMAFAENPFKNSNAR
jgi:hypothetical protein